MGWRERSSKNRGNESGRCAEAPYPVRPVYMLLRQTLGTRFEERLPMSGGRELGSSNPVGAKLSPCAAGALRRVEASARPASDVILGASGLLPQPRLLSQRLANLGQDCTRTFPALPKLTEFMCGRTSARLGIRFDSRKK